MSLTVRLFCNIFGEDLVIIISSDHGENQGELGIYAEHGTADHATCHIPLVIRWPGMTEGRRDAGLHYQLDLGPTLADLLDVPAPASWEGQSFGGVLRAHQTTVREGADNGREFLVLSQCAHVCQRSVRWGDWLYAGTEHRVTTVDPASGDESYSSKGGDLYRSRDGARGGPCLRGRQPSTGGAAHAISTAATALPETRRSRR